MSPSQNVGKLAEKNDEPWALVLRDLGEVLRVTRWRSLKWQAHRQLRTVDTYGIESFVPYTSQAIAMLEEALDFDSEDVAALHHLAIAYHALAWDQELAGDSASSQSWKKALQYWNKLQASSSFWQALTVKGRSIPGFVPGTISQFRHELIRYLLEIHVEFIRLYCEQNEIQRAIVHAELIREASLIPAARKKMEEMVYEALSKPIPDLIAGGLFVQAIETLEVCLRITPSYPPTLVTFMDTVREWAAQLNSSSPWDDLYQLDLKVFPHWQVLRTSPQLGQYPLALSSLIETALTIGNKYWAKAHGLLLERQEKQVAPVSTNDKEYQAYQRAIVWLEQVRTIDTSQEQCMHDLFNTLISKAQFQAQLAVSMGTVPESNRLVEESLADCYKAKSLGLEETISDELLSKINQLKYDLTA